MRVDLTTSGTGAADNASASRAERGAATNQTNDPNAAAAVDRAQFSFDPARIRSLTAQTLSLPEIRQTKVSSLAQAIGSGAYKVDTAKVASALASAYGAGIL